MASGIEEIECAWSQVSQYLHSPPDAGEVNSEIELALLRFLRVAQGVMSNTASNYDVSKLCIGLVVSAVAVLLSFSSAYRLLLKFRYSGAFLMFSTLSYGVMMFASSYVEEEQQFWYWLFTGWTFYLHTKSSGRRSQLSLSAVESTQSFRSPELLLANTKTIGFAIFHRILRRWNQTGQKFAGEPDVARNFLRFHQNTLWILIILTYADLGAHLFLSLPHCWVWRLIAVTVTVAAFTFKLTFVASDSPELLSNSFELEYMRRVSDSMSLILQARLVFGGIALLVILSAYASAGRRRTPSETKGKLWRIWDQSF